MKKLILALLILAGTAHAQWISVVGSKTISGRTHSCHAHILAGCGNLHKHADGDDQHDNTVGGSLLHDRRLDAYRIGQSVLRRHDSNLLDADHGIDLADSQSHWNAGDLHGFLAWACSVM